MLHFCFVLFCRYDCLLETGSPHVALACLELIILLWAPEFWDVNYAPRLLGYHTWWYSRDRIIPLRACEGKSHKFKMRNTGTWLKGFTLSLAKPKEGPELKYLLFPLPQPNTIYHCIPKGFLTLGEQIELERWKWWTLGIPNLGESDWTSYECGLEHSFPLWNRQNNEDSSQSS